MRILISPLLVYVKISSAAFLQDLLGSKWYFIPNLQNTQAAKLLKNVTVHRTSAGLSQLTMSASQFSQGS